jgi:hypothetical protein
VFRFLRHVADGIQTCARFLVPPFLLAMIEQKLKRVITHTGERLMSREPDKRDDDGGLISALSLMIDDLNLLDGVLEPYAQAWRETIRKASLRLVELTGK